MKHLSFRGLGTVINSGAVVIGSLIGLAVGGSFPDRVQDVAIFGIGLITMGLGVQMFLRTKNPLVTVGAICLGGILGALMGLDMGVEALAEWARVSLGGDSRFNEGFVTACVLFCIGPMTLMGCLQDALERKIELLVLKSLLDGVSSIFMAAALGIGVLVSAVFVLMFQGLLTGLAGFLSGFAKDEELVGESVACGGVIMLAIGLNITGIKEFSSVLFLPSLFLAPLFAVWSRRVLARFSKE